jgi:NAD-dependent dihydropyrimidine dehydrogenase PreA subunit/nitroreductase
MITIDNSKCNGCGLCVQICHEYCIKQDKETIEINYGYCSTCTQCIAVCPVQALSWDNSEPVAFNKELLPASLQLDELFKERRTVRDFKKDKIGRELLKEITEYGNYAPTHNFNMRLIIVDDDKVIEDIDKILYNFNKRLYRYLYKPKIIQALVKLFSPGLEFEYSKAKPKLEKSLERGKAFKSFPAAMLFIIADKRIPLSLESAQYILYNMNLYALTKGIGCRNLVGNQMFLNRSKVIRHLLNLQIHEKIFAVMALGFPSIKFSNKVVGKKMAIQWNKGNL